MVWVQSGHSSVGKGTWGPRFPHPFMPFPQCTCPIPCDAPTSPSSSTRSVRRPTQATSQTPWCVPVFGKRARTPARSGGRAWVSNHIPIPVSYLYVSSSTPAISFPTLTPSPPATPTPHPPLVPIPNFHGTPAPPLFPAPIVP